MPIMHT